MVSDLDTGREDDLWRDDSEPDDVFVVEVDGRRFTLVATAHISRASADLVRETIETQHPDCVCIELDDQRYEALSQKRRFEDLDLREVIRRQQLSMLLLSLMLVTYQRRLGAKLGILPGADLLEAARVAESRGIPISLCDRDVRITLRRAWGALSWWQKPVLVTSLVGSLFERPDLTEEDLRLLRQQDVVSGLMQELAEAFPALKVVLIDERDAYLAQKMKRAPGEHIVAVVGAGHAEGVRNALVAAFDTDLGILDQIPSASRVWRWIGWGIPVLILSAIGAIAWRKGTAAAGDSLAFWIVVNSLPSAAGALLALAHPITVLTAFVAAPFTSLTPVIGVGYVAAFAQLYFRPPRVRELRNLTQEITTVRRWWTNRLLRIFLVFLLTTLGSSIGTFVGGAGIFANLF